MRYLILDTAKVNAYTIYVMKEEFSSCLSLFKNTRDESLDDVAPVMYDIGMADFKERTSKYEHINLSSYLLIESSGAFIDVFLHFQKMLYKRKDNKEYFFRFYDPAVLQNYLAQNDKKTLVSFFGPADAFLFEAPGTADVKRYSLKGPVKSIKENSLKTEAGDQPVRAV